MHTGGQQHNSKRHAPWHHGCSTRRLAGKDVSSCIGVLGWCLGARCWPAAAATTLVASAAAALPLSLEEHAMSTKQAQAMHMHMPGMVHFPTFFTSLAATATRQFCPKEMVHFPAFFSSLAVTATRQFCPKEMARPDGRDWPRSQSPQPESK